MTILKQKTPLDFWVNGIGKEGFPRGLEPVSLKGKVKFSPPKDRRPYNSKCITTFEKTWRQIFDALQVAEQVDKKIESVK